jgi:cysteinyl-tRNA synthetase
MTSTLQLRNTLTRRVEPVEPLEPGRVRMYTCGPTVYRYAHVGHLRDEGFDRQADPMLVQAGLEDKTPGEIANAYEAAFHADEALVNILPAHVFPRATEHIPEMVSLAEVLEDAGYAYETPEHNVYYSVGAFDGYGRLSGNSLEDLRAGHRSDVEPDKRDSADFALWKAAGPGRVLKWATPRWGEGFPGWHLECSAMAMRYLGPTFDIHTGGIDNVFPHHEDEIAQSTPIVGEVPARHWVHGEFLLMDGRKMAKSAGNFQRVTELIDRGIDPLAFRYLTLTSRYARKLEYSDRSIEAAAAALGSLRAGLRALGRAPSSGSWAAPPVLVAGAAGDRPEGIVDGATGHGGGPYALADRASEPAAPLSPDGRAFHDRFVAATDDDLDMPGALALLRGILASALTPDEKRWLILDADAVLGLDLHRAWEDADDATVRTVPDDVEELVRQRADARAGRDFTTADRLRDQLGELGWDVVDGPEGSTVHRRT